MARRKKPGRKPRSIESRFNDLVERTGDARGDHWLWNGKAQFYWAEGRKITPSRAAWILHGKGAESLEGRTLHRLCDEPRCVRPGHHRLDNDRERSIRERIKKGRGNDPCHIWQGGTHDLTGMPRALLDGHQVNVVRWVWEQHYGVPVPAGVKIRQSCGNDLCVRLEHLEERPVKRRKGDDHHWTRLTLMEKREIQRLLSWEMFTQRHIARMFDCDEETIRIVKNMNLEETGN